MSSDGFEEPTVGEAVDAFEGRVFDVVESLPRPSHPHQFGLAEPAPLRLSAALIGVGESSPAVATLTAILRCTLASPHHVSACDRTFGSLAAPPDSARLDEVDAP